MKLAMVSHTTKHLDNSYNNIQFHQFDKGTLFFKKRYSHGLRTKTYIWKNGYNHNQNHPAISHSKNK